MEESRKPTTARTQTVVVVVVVDVVVGFWFPWRGCVGPCSNTLCLIKPAAWGAGNSGSAVSGNDVVGRQGTTLLHSYYQSFDPPQNM